jgi:hypothetical protein
MEWREVPCTGEPCIVCKEPIFGRQYQLHSIINGQAKPLDQAVCASCYVEIEREED